MKDVAARAGVSTATVSLVLNNTRYVSPALTERVLEAVRDLGYRPNGVARSLRRQSTRTVGVLIPTILSPFYPPLIKGVDDAISPHGLSMVLANTKESEESEAALIDLMWDERVNGLLISPYSAANIARLEELSRRGLPIVTFHRAGAEGRLDSVTWDDFGGTSAAVKHLVESGRRRIALLDSSSRGEGDEYRGSDIALLPRLRGYEAALAEAGLPSDPTLHLVGATSERRTATTAGAEAMVRALRAPHPPDAVVAVNHYMAIGVLSGARSVGARVPEDLAVVGYDDHPWAEELSTPLTVVSRDAEQMAGVAADLLLRRLAERGTGRPEAIVLPTKLEVRDSSVTRALA